MYSEIHKVRVNIVGVQYNWSFRVYNTIHFFSPPVVGFCLDGGNFCRWAIGPRRLGYWPAGFPYREVLGGRL